MPSLILRGCPAFTIASPRPEAVRAYFPKEAFQQLWDYNSTARVGNFLDEWCRQIMPSRIESMKKIAGYFVQHREWILNYFRPGELISSDVVKRPTNKAKATMRKSYGFRIYHSLGKLPEPESTPISSY